MQKKQNGFLIVFEGIDGAGKSTIAKALCAHLQEQGLSVFLTREPGGSMVGAELRKIVQQQVVPLDTKAEFLLFAADRAQHVADVIKPRLLNGELIISDRMYDSSYAYQGYGRGLNTDMIERVNAWVMQGIKADLTIYINVSLDVSLQRINARGGLSSFEKRDFLARVKDGFESLYAKKTDGVCIVNGDASLENVTKMVIKEVDSWMALQSL